MRVALCQFNMAWEDWRSNLRRAEQWVARADADLVILPVSSAVEAIRLAPPRRWVIRNGEVIAWNKVEQALFL